MPAYRRHGYAGKLIERAVAHYIDGKDIKEAKKLFKNEKKKGNKA